MVIGLVIGAYLATVGSSYACSELFDKAFDDKIKRMNLISTEPELYGNEKKLNNIMNKVKMGIIFAIPIINLVPIFMLFSFDSLTDSMITDYRKEGKLRKLEKNELEGSSEEVGYLQKRIEEVKKFQEQMGKKNIPRTYSELSYDEKIDVLLHELEIAYREKASDEGIDLSEMEAILEPMPGTSAPKGLKKTL